jgi:predicted deacylase
MRPNQLKAIAGVLVVIIVVGIVLIIIRSSSKPAPVVEVQPTATPLAVITKHAIIGKSVEGRDIEAYTYGNGATHLMFVGGIHGGYEWNSVLLVYKFMDYFEANPSIIPAGFTVTVIPSANPDGVFKVTGKVGRFNVADVSTDEKILASGRFNANKVDLNRNFDCKWQPKSTWQSKVVSAGSAAFSEPEAQALVNYINSFKPDAAVFWHSQSNAVYASKCEGDILPVTLDIMNAYSKAGGYPAVKTFDAYGTTGAADDWLASMNVPAITVEMITHTTIEWEKNLAGVKAILGYFEKAVIK